MILTQKNASVVVVERNSFCLDDFVNYLSSSIKLQFHYTHKLNIKLQFSLYHIPNPSLLMVKTWFNERHLRLGE